MRCQPTTWSSRYSPPQPGRDPALRGRADHLRHHEPGAADRPRAEVDEVEVAHGSVDRGVHVHRRDDDAVGQHEIAQAERQEHRRDRPAAVRALHGPGEVLVDARDEPGIAHAQVVVGDAAAARQQVEREHAGLLADVARDALEPLEARLRGALRALHDRPALVLVGGERGPDVAAVAERPREGDRVLHRELRARPDREVRGVRGVAEQHDVLVRPVLVADGVEVQPARVVGDERVVAEDVGEQLAAERDALLVVLARREGMRLARVEPGAPPRLLVGLDDEGRHRLVVGVAVDLEDAVLGLHDVERERLEDEVGAEPHELAPAPVERRPEVLGAACRARRC